jgi:transposase
MDPCCYCLAERSLGRVDFDTVERTVPGLRTALEKILLDDNRLDAGYQLLQRFRRLIVRGSVSDLDQWLKDAGSSGLRPFVSLAHGIGSDYAAVVNGLTLPWSTGPVEGTVTKVKCVS